MANTIYDPVMSLTIPVPQQDPGPDYANNISNNHFNIAYHKHTGQGDGYQLGAAALNIDNDVSWNIHNITNLRSERFHNNTSTLIGAQDLNCVYVANNNLYFNTSTGTAVPIIQNGALAAFSFLQYTIQSVTGATWTVLYTDTYNLLAVNVAAASAINLPRASTVPPGRFYVVKDASNNAGTNNITLNVAGSSGDTFACSGLSTYVVGGNGASVLVYSDGASKWFTLSQNNIAFGETLTIAAGATLALNGLVSGGVAFTAADTTPEVFQFPTTSGNGATFHLQSQTTTATFSNGGNMIIASGQGGASGVPGNIQLLYGDVVGQGILIGNGIVQCFGGVTGLNPAFQVNNWSGSANTQNYGYYVYTFNVSTTNGGSNVQFAAITVPNNTSVMLEVDWIRRTTTAPGMSGNKQIVLAENNGGLVTNNSLTGATGSGPPAFAPLADIVVGTSGNNVLLSAHAAAVGANLDWTIVVKALYC